MIGSIGQISFDISQMSFEEFSVRIQLNSHKKALSSQMANDQNQTPSQADELEERLINFAVRIIQLSSHLPRTPAGRHISGQILRSGTSPAPNYGEARGAESRADFVHKIRVVLKELNETSIWLRIIERSELLKVETLTQIIPENRELCKIFASSLKTARTGKTNNI